jgi:glutamine cyclotransferase
VSDKSGPLTALNELEYAGGFIYANVWTTDRIVKIDPATGSVTGLIDLTPLCNKIRASHPEAKELNGIAWHPASNSFLITGKYWPSIHMLKLQNQ